MDRSYGWLCLLIVALLALPGGCASSRKRREIEMEARVAYNTGVGYLRQGEIGRAQRYLRQAVELDPKNAEYHHALGLVYQAQGQAEAALECLRTSIELNDDNPEVFNNLASVYLMLERPKEALEAVERALSDGMYMTPAAGLYNKAKALQMLGRRDEAKAALQEAVDREPLFDRALFELGQYAMEEKRYDVARDYFRKAAEANPQYLRAIWSLALANQALGDRAATIRTLKKLLEKVPEDSELAEKASRLLNTLQPGS